MNNKTALDFMNDYNVEINYSNWSLDPDVYSERISDHRHQVVTGRAIKTYRNMKNDDSVSEEDLFAAWSFFMICLNARKYKLDIDKAAKDFNFDDLERKYMK